MKFSSRYWRNNWRNWIPLPSESTNTIWGQNPVSFTATIGTKSMTRYTSSKQSSPSPAFKQLASAVIEHTFPGTHKISQDGILQFGKHKGKHVSHVMTYDPGWLRWALTSGALSSRDLNAEAEAEVSGKLEEQEEVSDRLGELWDPTTEAHSTTRKVDENEFRSDGTWIFHTRFFP